MKATVYSRYGPPGVLSVTQRPRPNPGQGDVLIRVIATTVTSAECGMRRGEPRWGRAILGFTRPRRRMRVLGTEVAGVVDSVGADVTRFGPGDHVFGFTGFRLGGNAEYTCLPETASIAIKPSSVGFGEAAAAVDGATTALYFLRDRARIQPGQRVAVVGASGSIGTYAIQLAKHFGAEVTAVCGPTNADLVASLGADHIVDHTADDFSALGQRYDVIFDTVGATTFAHAKQSLTRSGVYLPTTGLWNTVLAPWTAIWRGRRVVTGMSVRKHESLSYIKALIESGELTIIIDRTFTLDQIADAHRHVETGHKRGNVVVRVAPEPPPAAVLQTSSDVQRAEVRRG